MSVTVCDVDLLASLGPGAIDCPEVVRVGDRALSSEALTEAAGAVARQVAGAAVVALDATAALETIVGLIGALAAGATVVPVPADAGRAERAHVLGDSGASVVVGAAGRAERFGAAGDAGGSSFVPVDVDARASLRPVPPAGDRPALLLYTSGTTGPPKGVPITRAAIGACLDGVADAWAWTGDDVVAHGLPLWHVHGLVLGVLGPLHRGGRLVHTGRPTPAAYASAVADHRATLLFGVPTVWSRVVADRSSCAVLRAARLLVSGSAPLPLPVFAGLASGCGQAPLERYGMTETLITLSTRADGERRPGWVGVPLVGVETRVLDDAGDPVAPDGESIGDLEVRGPTVMAGYHDRARGRPQGPSAGPGDQSFAADRWFRTGDVAAVDGGGQHRLLGRRSTDLVKSGGYRIGTGEVEAVLLSHPAVSEAAVVGLPDEDLGAVLVAYVVADGVTAAALSDFVADELAVHKRPRRVEFVPALPRNAMGKINKVALGD